MTKRDSDKSRVSPMVKEELGGNSSHTKALLMGPRGENEVGAGEGAQSLSWSRV